MSNTPERALPYSAGKAPVNTSESARSCPLNIGCESVSCPQCGHSFPRTSRIVGWVRRLLGRYRSRSQNLEGKSPW